MRESRSKKGFILLEVLIAVSILSLGATSAVRVFAQSLRAKQRLEEISLGTSAAEKLLFEANFGEIPGLLADKRGRREGEVSLPVATAGQLTYEITSEPMEGTSQDYRVTLKIRTPLKREIYETVALLRNEG